MTRRQGMRAISLLSAAALMVSVLSPGNGQTVEAAKKATLKAKKISVQVGKKKKIVIKNKVSKAKYTFESKKKKVATVTKKGVVKGVKAGKATIVVTEKKGKKKRTVGKVKVTVTRSAGPVLTQSPVTNPPATSSNPTNPPVTSSNPTNQPGTSSNPTNPTNPPVTSSNPTNPPVTSADPTDEPDGPTTPPEDADPVDGVTFPNLPLVEDFEDEANAVIRNSDTAAGKTVYKAEGGLDNSGYAVIKQSQWSGPVVFLDNREGTSTKKYVVSAYVKAERDEDKYIKAIFYGGNTYDASKYLANKYDTIVSRKLNTEWEQILKVISVPAGKFREVRVICTAADFGIDHMEAKELADGAVEPTMAPEITEPAPDNAETETFTMTGNQLKPYAGDGNSSYTEKADGSVEVEGGWRYYAIALPNPVDLSKFSSIQIEGDVSGGYRWCFKDKGGTFFIEDPDKPDEWKYPNAFTGSSELQFSSSGYAYYLILGTKGSDAGAVNFNLKSITFKKGVAPVTDGITEAIKPVGQNNPIAASRFMADPYAIEYEGTVYVYGTNDSDAMIIGEDGKVPKNSYSHVKSLNCYSSKDMVNWTDEGIIQVAGKTGPAKWASNSWAPAVAHKKINGKDKFFIYFADNGSGIGVLEGDSPTGPWKDPIGKQLISRDTPNCSGSEVPWLFDPAVLVDDDGRAYLYFGGIGEMEDRDHPRCNRVVELNDDMISLKGDPVEIDAPGAFEDSGINKINGKYYYSYCTNWDGSTKRPDSGSLGVANIAYMVSDSPMGPWSDAKSVLKNPTEFFEGLPTNEFNNNHHCMLVKDGQIYMFYHSQFIAADKGFDYGYRTSGVDLVTVDKDGNLHGTMTKTGLTAIKTFDPFAMVEAETFAWANGVSTIAGPAQDNTRNNRVLSSIKSGDWVGLDNVAFGDEGAQSLTMSIANASETGSIEIYVDEIKASNKKGTLTFGPTGEAGTFKDVTLDFDNPVTGTHKLFFVFKAKDILVDTWKFSK